MKTTVVPAQITTVEDRIMGNLTFAQILLLVVPLLTSTVTYVAISPHAHLNLLKLFVIVLQFAIFGLLAVRVNGKILAEWLVVYFRFFLRPRVYVFTKNDLIARDVLLEPKIDELETKIQKSTEQRPKHKALSVRDQVTVNRLLESPSHSISFGIAANGGIDVSLTPVKE